jgi:hypothetical protein
MAEKKYMLEITAESREGGKHRYIRRSFPVSTEKPETIELKKYGYPYSAIGSIRPGKVSEAEEIIHIPLGRLECTVYLNGFTTVKWDDGYMTNMGHVPGTKEITVTFYLYVE